MIRLDSICFGYKKKPIFKDFSLHIGPGESVLITGINGVGKTTLLRLMSGVLFPRSGRIIYADSLGKEPRAKIGFISDKTNLYENLTLEQAIRFHSSVYGIANFDSTLIRHARLDTNQKIASLSRGQKLIFHLNLILAARPEILLVDEVIHNLDVVLREMFLTRLLEIMEENQITLVMVNLNFHDIEKIPQRVLLLKDNRIALDEPLDVLKARVKKLATARELKGLPVLFRREFEDGFEYYIYPFEEHLLSGIRGKIIDLNLHDIIKALIGGEYAL